MTKIGLIFKKELLNAVRDRRVLISTVIIPLLVLPIVTMLPMMMIGRKQQEAREKPSRIAVTGLKYAELDQALESSNRFTIAPEESISKAIRLGTLDAAVEVAGLPDGRQSAQVKILFNATRTESNAAADKVKLVIADLSKAIVARQVDTTKVNLNPVLTIPTNVASEHEMAGFFLGMLIGMMAIIGLITGGMVMAVDSTAGEKERKTLEVLLAAPVRREEIVIGKFLATLVTGMASVILMTLGYTFSIVTGFRAIGGAGELGLGGGMTISLHVVLIILLVMLCVAAFIAALEMAVAIFARSYREAQGYLTPLTIIAIIPVVFMQTMSANPDASMFYIPLMNAMLLIRELLMGSVVGAHIINTIASSAVYAALALRLALAMFRRESVLLR